MASLRQIKRRMKSIENIHEITKAMEMIAAFRFKRAENRFSKSRHYMAEMEKLVTNLSAAVTDIQDPLFEKRPVRKKTLVVMTGDKGLCGAYNTNILRAAALWLKDNAGKESSFVAIGKVGHEFLKKRVTPVVLAYPEKAPVDAAKAKMITAELKELFLSGKTDSIEVLYTNFRVGGSGQNKIVPVLPLGYLLEAKKTAAAAPEYIAEPDFSSLFKTLVSKFVEGKLFLQLLESLTSEYSARMVAMKQATENGEEVLDDLKLLRNKTRQATITRELSEIVSGASILV